MISQYDARDVILDVGGAVDAAVSDGEFVTVSYDSERVTEHEGAKGHVTVLISASRKATAVITLGQSSSTNARFAAMLALQQRPGNGLVIVPFLLKHINGTTLVNAPQAWIRIPPPVTFAAEHSPRPWTFGLGDAQIFVGGATR